MLDFNASMLCLVDEIVRVVPEFHMIRTDRLRVSATFNQSSSRSGLVAYLLPLKYKDGRPFEHKIRGQRIYHYGMVPVYHNGTELLYIIYFMLPRFLNLSLREKLETVIHELYHVSPHYNGDVRRLKGRSYLHGNSLKAYDRTIAVITDRFLSASHDPETYAFLKGNHSVIRRRFGKIEAMHMVEPKPTLLKVARLRQSTETQMTLFE
ncbi:MAG: hypothetical protein KDD51_01665 [Bdellovibrionales bacterium]|nr:hypothetical protein [Bdellovibrionales bacterium]